MQQFLRRTGTGLTLVALLGLFYFFSPLLLSIFFLFLLSYIVAIEWPQIAIWCKHYRCKFLLLCYFIFPFILLTLLNHSPQRQLVLVLLSMVFIFDTSSYLIGTATGRTHIWPSLTPKKTWEGLIGGMLFTMLFSYFLIYLLGGSLRLGLTLFSLFVCMLAFMGDLFESFLKRRARLKDIGNILPGHGGMLDRFDSILLVSYFFYFLREPLMHFLGL